VNEAIVDFKKSHELKNNLNIKMKKAAVPHNSGNTYNIQSERSRENIDLTHAESNNISLEKPSPHPKSK